jgi:hypothetical protein
MLASETWDRTTLSLAPSQLRAEMGVPSFPRFLGALGQVFVRGVIYCGKDR